MANLRAAPPIRLAALRLIGADGSRLLLGSLSASLLSLILAAASSATETAYPLDETPFAGRLIRSDSEWNLHFQTGDKVRVLPARELAYYGRYRDGSGGAQIVLNDGSLVRSDVLSIDDDEVVLGDATGLGRGQWDESVLPRRAVRAIVLQPPAGKAERDALFLTLRGEAADDVGGRRGGALTDDRLLLLGGESVTGTLVSAPLAGRFETEQAESGGDAFEILREGAVEPLAIAAGRVVALRFGSFESPAPTSTEPFVWLGTSDGSLIRVRETAVSGDLLTLSLAAGGKLHTTVSGRDRPEQTFWDGVTYVEPASPRVVWLSDLAPIGYKHIPFVSVERPYGRDANVLGTRLRIDGAVVRKGLGMPSASRLAYDVAGFRKFEAELALDERAGLEGSVVFKVLLETAPGQWAAAYESPTLRGGDPPLAVSVPLQGASRMALLVDFADRGDTRDYANWLHARLIK